MSGLRKFPHHNAPAQAPAASKPPLAPVRLPVVRRVGVALPIDTYVAFKTRLARDGRTGEAVIAELIRAWAAADRDDARE